MDIQLFNFNSNEIRVLIKEETGEPWWVAKDVCDILDLTGSITMHMERLDEDEVSKTEVIDSMQRKQSTYIINESGLYNLIFRSNKPEAKAFRKWITSEVLPTIRKTGSYNLASKLAEQQVIKLYVTAVGKWHRMFPPQYYELIHRLKGWDYDPNQHSRSHHVAWLTKRLVYDCLPPGVLEALEETNPAEAGQRRHKHHQFLSEEQGKQHLKEQIQWVLTMGEYVDNIDHLLTMAQKKREKLYGRNNGLPGQIPLFEIETTIRLALPA